MVLGTDGQKMSKSYNNTICMFDEPKKLRKTIMRIKTDSSGVNESKSFEKCLLFNLYSEFANEGEKESLKNKYKEGVGWGEVKEILFQKISYFFEKPYKKYLYYTQNPKELEDILQEGAKRVRQEASPFLKEIRKAVGI